MKYLHFALIAILMIAGCDQTATDPMAKNGTSSTGGTGSVSGTSNANGMNSSSGTSNSSETTTPVDRDNSGVNKRDRDTNAKTPIDQNEDQADINITAGIRKLVVNAKMSVNAENVKIITQDGSVTLRGPVKSPEEKKQIEEIARNFAGVKTVDNQLEVESNP